MSEPFLGEIRAWPLTWTVEGWAPCDGRLLAIAQYTALFSLLGTTFGGDGRTTFGLPNLSGRMPVGQGRGPGLTLRRVGETGGVSDVTLSQPEIPPHTHSVHAVDSNAAETAPGPDVVLAKTPAGRATKPLYDIPDSYTLMNAQSVSNTGGNQAHENRQPYLMLNYQIALQGIYPPRS
ncbi:tail fiber protein [Roseospira goensis]|uniref:Microcystin-dependent protein n=1 Tax=Roseospira goensis TaxID=391922 RepID=A0A7W6WL62_9PROT|nr:microcystin-dependent protein [Roseospira goensis]